MKEFITAARVVEDEAHDGDGSVEFPIVEQDADGNETSRIICRAYRPNDGQLAVLMATNSRHSSQQEKVAGIINFFVAVLDETSHTYIVSRLLDAHDAFGLEQVQDILEALIEEWSGRPTLRSSGSTPSRKTTGQKSTRPTPALT